MISPEPAKIEEKKNCYQCFEELPISEFYTYKLVKGGIGIWRKCKACVKKYAREYYHKPEIKEKYQGYWQEHSQKPEIKEKRQKYYREWAQKPESKEIRRKHSQKMYRLKLLKKLSENKQT